MKINEIIIPKGAKNKSPKRRGRGSATGVGGTSGKGGKGQTARAGKKLRRGFEGGQMPLNRRLPKRGFTCVTGTDYAIVNIEDIIKKGLEGEITPEVLKESGLIRGKDIKVKILGDGTISKALKIRAHAVSKSAREKIVNAGGTIEVI